MNLNGFSDSLGGLTLIIGPNGGAAVNLGASGSMPLTGNVSVQTLGTGNPNGATISGGTLPLNVFGDFGAALTRTFLVNDGATGDDLTITSAITDGSGLRSANVTKQGVGTLVYGGTAANTYTGTTTVNEGTLALNKPAGVNAFAGALVIGDGNVPPAGTGGLNSDVVQLRQRPDSRSPGPGDGPVHRPVRPERLQRDDRQRQPPGRTELARRRRRDHRRGDADP